MAEEKLSYKINCAWRVIWQAFARLGDLNSENVDLRVGDGVRSTSSQERQSLRWTLPFLWLALVYLSFMFNYCASRSFIPVLTESECSGTLQRDPVLVSFHNQCEHSPFRSEDPCSGDLYINDSDLEFQTDQVDPDIFESEAPDSSE